MKIENIILEMKQKSCDFSGWVFWAQYTVKILKILTPENLL